MRVILLVLDGFPVSAITPRLTPELWSLGENGGHAPDGGRCELPSSTYPSHATLITGRMPQHHHVWSSLASNPQTGVVPGWAGDMYVTIPTLFDQCHKGKIKCAAIIGDNKLYSIIRSDAADYSWPQNGIIPTGIPTDAYGYPTNKAVFPYLYKAVRNKSFSFIFAQLNESDTIEHLYGPNSLEARIFYRETDGLMGELIYALKEDWSSTVLIVLSDHGMETLLSKTPIDLRTNNLLRELVKDFVDEDGCCLVLLHPGVELEQLKPIITNLPGVKGWRNSGSEFFILEAELGHVFGTLQAIQNRGIHGGLGSAHLVTIVGGGHPMVRTIAEAIRSHPPHLADWAPTIASLLSFPFHLTDGQNLISPRE